MSNVYQNFKIFPFIFIFLIIWVSAWLYVSRAHMLDDTLIHLRYAELLNKYHFLTFDGIEKNYGTSSILYVAILALINLFSYSVFSAKMISVFFYIGTLTIISLFFYKTNHLTVKLLYFALLAILVSPMAIRWLTDGMETSLVVFICAILAILSWRAAINEKKSPFELISLFLMGFLIVALRIEMILLVFLSLFGILFYRISNHEKEKSGFFRRALNVAGGSIILFFGSASALISIYLITGYLLPDTAIAKSINGFVLPSLNSFILILAGVFKVILSSFSFGIGLLLIWIITLFLFYKTAIGNKKLILFSVIINSAFPFLALIIILRNQSMQGIRYFIGYFLFMIIWNINAISFSYFKEKIEIDPHKFRKIIFFLLLTIFIVWVFESGIVFNIVQGRSESLLKMQSQNLSILKDEIGIAADIGFVSYFTKAKICDISGLVYGREFAKQTGEYRVDYCIQQNPSFLFINKNQEKILKKYIEAKQFIVCSEYDFPNVSTNDTHYLLVKNKDVCDNLLTL